mgnify:CR=1 FL=1
MAEFWDNVSVDSPDEMRQRGVTNSRRADERVRRANFATAINRGDHYVARVSGFLTPRETGEYYFYIAADEAGEFRISPSARADEAKMVVRCATAVNPQAWDRERRRSEAIRLEKGKRYAVEALLCEKSGDDHIEIAWSRAAADRPTLITGDSLSCFESGAWAAASPESAGRAEADLVRAAERLTELFALCEPEAASADELQKQVAKAKEALREAEACVKRVDEALARR